MSNAVDSISQSYGLKDGFTFCGSRIYSELGTAYPWIALDTNLGTFDLQTSDSALAMTSHSVTLMVELSLYSSVFATISFTVQIGYDCLDATLTIPASIPLVDQSYIVTDPALSQDWLQDYNLVDIDSFLNCGDISMTFSQ